MKFLFALACLGCWPLIAQASPRSASVPLIVVHNRAYVEVQLERKDGSLRQARFWVDNGNPELAISQALGRDLGLDLSNTGKNGDGMPVATVALPRMLIGGLQIGDKVLKIDGIEMQGKTLGEVIDALHGHPGSRRSLLIERKGARFTFNAAVARLL